MNNLNEEAIAARKVNLELQIQKLSADRVKFLEDNKKQATELTRELDSILTLLSAARKLSALNERELRALETAKAQAVQLQGVASQAVVGKIS